MVRYTVWAFEISFHWYPTLIYHLVLFVSNISEKKGLPALEDERLLATGGKERSDKRYFNKFNLNLGFDRKL